MSLAASPNHGIFLSTCALLLTIKRIDAYIIYEQTLCAACIPEANRNAIEGLIIYIHVKENGLGLVVIEQPVYTHHALFFYGAALIKPHYHLRHQPRLVLFLPAAEISHYT